VDKMVGEGQGKMESVRFLAFLGRAEAPEAITRARPPDL
jgi:hypothetical protein